MMTGDATVNRDAPHHLLHGRDPRQHRARASGDRRRRRLRGDGRVPLLLGQRARRRLAGAAAHPAARALPADERDARRRRARSRRCCSEHTGADVVTVQLGERPVPLEFEYQESPLHEAVADAGRRRAARRSTS